MFMTTHWRDMLILLLRALQGHFLGIRDGRIAWFHVPVLPGRDQYKSFKR